MLTGLSTAEVVERLVQSGPNEVRQRRRVSVWSSVGVQLRDPMIVVLLAAAGLTIFTGDLADAAVIALVVVVNTTVGVAQELRADRAVTALAQLSVRLVRVRRDGLEASVSAAGLVPGDCVLLGEGDIVPADGELLEASSLIVDESALTGESVPIGKRGPRGQEVVEGLSSGTMVVRGRAVLLVMSTGASSALGQIAALMDTRVQPTPLQRRLSGLGRTLALVAVALCTVVLISGLVRGQPVELMVVTAISLAVAAVPESLPAVVTFSLATGARRMAARSAIVRRLPAVETLGSVTVLATDKTGTLTLAQMIVERLWTPERTVSLSGQGFEPRGELFSEGRVLDPTLAPDVVALLRAGALCNDATLVAPAGASGIWSGLGDPTEVAILVAAGKIGLSRTELAREYTRVGEVPFDSGSQRMTTTHERAGAAPRRLVITKGSVEALYASYGAGRHALVWDEAKRQASKLADLGFRVLAVAAGEVAKGANEAAADLLLLGLVAMNDPVKPAARSTILACVDAGIVPVLITGDHPATAKAVAVRVGLLDAEDDGLQGSVATGDQIAAGQVLDLTVPRVFARTNPEQKLDVIQAWKDRGAVVAMTGDGVNDGPALRRADIGVAMGHNGTEVARQAADLVLADDDLATLVSAVEEGRRVYANIRRFLVFGLSGGAAEILVMLVGPFRGLAVPLLAAQILWINLLTHGLTGIALGAEPAEQGLMHRPPRPPEQSVLGDGLWQRVLVLAVVLSVVTLGLGLWAQDTGRAWQSMIFVALTSLQLGVALGLRPHLLTRQNVFLPVAVSASLLLALAGVYFPALQDLLGTVALPAGDAAIAVAAGVLGWSAIRVERWARRSTSAIPG